MTLTGSGPATCSTSSLTQGTHLITASYSGNSSYLASTATMFQLVVQPTTTTLASTPNPATFGQTVILTARVRGRGGSVRRPIAGVR